MSNAATVGQLLNGQKVVPVVVIEDEVQALGLAKAILDGGMNAIEVTLRSPYALDAIKLIKQEFPQMVMLAGTVTSAAQMEQVAAANVDGVISPGLTDALLKSAQETGTRYLPGVATGSEVLKAMEYGLSECKLFPATVAGGVSALKAFGGPFYEMQFCPTGGVSPANYQDFLALNNVFCVGGSWLAPAKLVAEHRWQEITDLCKAVS